MTRPSSAPLRLRRGVLVTDRPPGLVQVGADPHQRVLLPDTPPIRELLRLLASDGAPRPRGASLTGIAERLQRAGLLVDVEELARLRRLRHGRPVKVTGPDPWAGDLADLLTASGARLCSRAEPSAQVLLTFGEPDRQIADDLATDAVPVLFVAVVDACVRVGPFVVPGLTACLRCMDAHARERDAQTRALAPAVVPTRMREFPLDHAAPALALGLALAAGDLLAWVEGRRPASWSRSTWISDTLDQRSHEWTRHPHCGCAWQDQLRSG